ncbi:zinc finger BED domain-containing protein 5-like [Emys orbicularis]|uniref:zinc finger BED domain-containing protein 5-like n=1 Tax=Emys orbicularis TaxID=82168 RepID=UPI0031FD26B7
MDKWLKKESVETQESASISSSPHCGKSTSNDHDGPGKSLTKKRKYDDDYIKYGFTCTGDQECPKPLCVICGDVLANSSLKPSLLRRHLETRHPAQLNKPVDFFKRKLAERKSDITSFISKASTDNENALEASYRVSYRVAKASEAHTIAESLIGPCIKDVVHCMLGEKAAKRTDMVPLSNNSLSRRINDMSNNVETTIVQSVKNSPYYAIQLDESTDVANLAILLLFVHYVNEGLVEEDLLFCRPLEERTTGEDIFNLTNAYFQEKEIDWSHCLGICTDVATSMTGKYTGFVARTKKVVSKVSWTHCSIHRQALATKHMPEGLKEVLDNAVKMVNFIKSRPTNSRIFHVLCEEMGSIHDCLLTHTEVRWLSWGKILVRLFELRTEILVFFNSHPFHLASYMENNVWLQSLAYLADIFSRINDLNLSLQGLNITVFNVQDRVESMIKKLQFWESCLENNQTECFSNLHDFLAEHKLQLDQCTKTNITAHLKGLCTTFRDYFPAISGDNDWIRNPFDDTTFSTQILNTEEKEKLIEISCDYELRRSFRNLSLINFWLSLRN